MVIIQVYKKGEHIKECQSIQETGLWLKEHTEDKLFRFTRIERGYCYGVPWDFNGARYKFVASEENSKPIVKHIEIALNKQRKEYKMF